jgi:glycosyltransferase involved in cell wall biosynthesis
VTPRIVILEPSRSNPDRDGGSRAVADLLDVLDRDGWQVESIALDEVDDRGALLERLNDPNLVVVSSRPEAGIFTASSWLDQPFKVFLGHDLHHRRLGRWRDAVWGTGPETDSDTGPDTAPDTGPDEIADQVPDDAVINRMHRLERRCWQGHDVSLYPDRDEADVVNLELGEDRAMRFPYFVVEPQPESPDLDRARPDATDLAAAGSGSSGPATSFVFIGGSRHAPNRDGVRWFVRDVLPTWGGRLQVIGDWSAEARAEFEGQASIEFSGPVSDEALRAIARAADWAIAPLRFGAGVKRKVLHYLQLGLPMIATPVAIEGLPRPLPTAALIVAPPREWATTSLATDGGLAPRPESARYLRQHFSRFVLRDAWLSVLARRSKPSCPPLDQDPRS